MVILLPVLYSWIGSTLYQVKFLLISFSKEELIRFRWARNVVGIKILK